MNIPYNFKKCSQCGQYKVASTKFFYRYAKGKFGLMYKCKECSKKEIRTRTDKTKEKYKKDLNFTEEERRKKIKHIMLLGDIPYEKESCVLVKVKKEEK